jgi:hypothetical protein
MSQREFSTARQSGCPVSIALKLRKSHYGEWQAVAEGDACPGAMFADITMDPTGLTPGVYKGTLEFFSSFVKAQTVRVPVTMTVAAAGSFHGQRQLSITRGSPSS